MWREALGEVNGEQGRGGSDDAGQQRRGERRGQHRCIPCLGAACLAGCHPIAAPCGPPLCSRSGGTRPCAAVLIQEPPSPGSAPPRHFSPLRPGSSHRCRCLSISEQVEEEGEVEAPCPELGPPYHGRFAANKKSKSTKRKWEEQIHGRRSGGSRYAGSPPADAVAPPRFSSASSCVQGGRRW